MEAPSLYQRLGITAHAVDDETGEGSMPLIEDTSGPGGLRAAALGLLLEWCCGAPLIRGVAAVPSDLVINLNDSIAPIARLVAKSRVVRRGRTLAVTEGWMADPATPTHVLAYGTIGWTVVGPAEPFVEGPEGDEPVVGEPGGLLTASGITVLPDAPGCQVESIEPGCAGPGGVLHAGVLQLMSEVAALSLTASDEAMSWVTASQHLRFLAPARVGPFVARPKVLDAHPARVAVRTLVTDTGNEDRPVAHAYTLLHPEVDPDAMS